MKYRIIKAGPWAGNEELKPLWMFYHGVVYPAAIRFYHRHNLKRFFNWNHR